MASHNGSRTATKPAPAKPAPAKPAAAPQQGRMGRQQQQDEEVEIGGEEGGHAGVNEMGADAAEEMAASEVGSKVLKVRRRSRRINLDGDQPKSRKRSEAVVKTLDGNPDLRFAENRNKYLADPTKKASGEQDFRFLENRPDIIALHEQRGDDRPNVIFDDDEEG